MKMEKKKFRIGELADKLGVERFVIRFWEKEFNLKSSRSDGGQRFYSEEDLALFTHIKTLLYEEGFTISGAKKNLAERMNLLKTTAQKTTIHEKKEKLAHKTDWDQEELAQHITSLKKQLQKLRELL